MGVYKSGDSLPSINQLSQAYEVSRDTVFKAFLDLKERGIIDSTPGKGYYVVGRLKNVLLLLDEYSPFKYALYNSFVKRLSIRYKVDLLFHQYNERLFNTIIRESLGRYYKYIVMNFDQAKINPTLQSLNPTFLNNTYYIYLANCYINFSSANLKSLNITHHFTTKMLIGTKSLKKVTATPGMHTIIY